jgi:HEAT repeat protein
MSREQRFRSGNPLDRAEAVIEATEARDLNAVHTLVDLLEDPDAAVRMLAIVALRRLTDRDYGYRFYEDDLQRAAAVARWRAALRAGEVEVVPPPKQGAVATSTEQAK